MTGRPADSPPPVPRWVGAAAILAALWCSEPVLEALVVPDGEIGSTLLRAMLLVFDVAAAAYGAWVLLRRPRSRIPWNRLAVAVVSALTAWFVAFALVDTLAPEMLQGTGIRYFVLRGRFQPDSTLVMVPRRTGQERSYDFRGDLHVPTDDIPDPAVEYRASYNEWGFRTNGGAPPFRMVVIGDSFLAIGEQDSLTLSEMIRRTTGLSTFNLSRGWYGPHHYVEMLRRYGVPLDPAFALLFFFEGNDAENSLAYERWREGGDYLRFSHAEGSLLRRFATATADLVSFLQWQGARRLGIRQQMAEALGEQEPLAAPNTSLVHVGGKQIPVKFGYWPEVGNGSVEALLATPRWGAVRRALTGFRDTAVAHGIIPVFVFVPTKATTYADRIVETPPRFRGPEFGVPGEGPSAARAVSVLADDLDVASLDLTPLFQARAVQFPLLFYPQDTHWAPEGRRLAARAVADFMRERWPDSLEPYPASEAAEVGSEASRRLAPRRWRR